ncbi:14956_t:CDS:2, partial [Funneliformis geosporum]
SEPLNATITNVPSTSTSEIRTDATEKKQTDTGQNDEELIVSLGLVEGDSRVRQGCQLKQITMQYQVTSQIIIENDVSENNNDKMTPDASNHSAN